MKKFLFLILLFSFQHFVSAQTIPVNLVTVDTIGACLENRFVASFNADSSHRISIEPLLDFNGDSVNSCLAQHLPKRLGFVFQRQFCD